MPSKTTIFNAALTHIGAGLVSAADENSEEAKVCRARYDQVLDATLRGHPWNSARARKAVGSSGTPDFEYAKQYTLPPDPFCLRVIDLYDSEEPWVVEGRLLLTDAPAPIKLRYVFRLTNPGLMDALLLEALSLHLAVSIAYKQSDSSRLEGRLWDRYVAWLRMARNVDGQEGIPKNFFESEITAVRA